MAEMVGGELATVRRFKRPLLIAGAASGGALTRESTPKVVVGAEDPPPGGGSVRESSSQHGVGGLAWKRERRWGKVVMGALRCSYL
jgi:hypothetical protein